MDHRHVAGMLALALVLLLNAAAPVFSQSSGNPPPIDKSNNPDRVRHQDMSRREYQLRNSGIEPEIKPDRRQLEAKMAQTAEDFNRILTLHNEIARALSSNKDLDYKFVSEATGEIRKRASRLQDTLALGELNKEESNNKQEVQTETDNPQVKASLVNLCNYIKQFVLNPVIDKPGTVNAEELVKARKDLESLIQLSGRIKRDADKLAKD